MARSLRVLLLVGSAVNEFYADLSRLYAADCLDAVADPERYELSVAHVSPDGSWCFPADLRPQIIAAAPRVGLGEAVTQLQARGLDAVVPQMFCVPGMTQYRALVELAGIPLLGNPADVMALGAHKARARAVVAAAGVAVPDGELLRAGEQPGLTPPFVVKPVDTDNSLGLALVREHAELAAALRAAFVESDEVLVERYVELGREVRCGIVVRDGELVGLPLEEYAVHPESKPIRLHDDKIRTGTDGGLGLVAKDAEHAWIVDVEDPLTAVVHEAAKACHRALGCRDYSLFDFRVDPDGQPWFLEAGLYCSFARSSVVAVMAAAAGLELPELFETVLTGSLARRRK
ncbi:MAG: D-alanine--D-alanine ligase [Mycobacteriaceae bacterium]